MGKFSNFVEEAIVTFTWFFCIAEHSRKYQNKIKHIEFIRLNNEQIMSIIASENGLVENRILDADSAYSESTLKQASNYLNAKFEGKTIESLITILCCIL